MIEKEAQRRGFFSQLGESLNVKRRFSEWVSEMTGSNYKEVMDLIRSTDDSIREYAEKIPEMIREMDQAFSAHRWADAVQKAADVQSVIGTIVMKGRQLNNDATQEIREFYFTKGAGISEWVTGIGETWSRNQQHRAMQQRYRDQLKVIRQAVTEIVRDTKRMADQTLSALKVMSSSRNSGDIAGYVGQLKTLEDKYSKYRFKFSNLYNKHISGYIDEIKAPEQNRLPSVPVKDPPKEEIETAPVSTENVINTPAQPASPVEQDITIEDNSQAAQNLAEQIAEPEQQLSQINQLPKASSYIDQYKKAIANNNTNEAIICLCDYSEYLDSIGNSAESIKIAKMADELAK